MKGYRLQVQVRTQRLLGLKLDFSGCNVAWDRFMNLLKTSFNIGEICPGTTLVSSNVKCVCQFGKQSIAIESCFEGEVG